MTISKAEAKKCMAMVEAHNAGKKKARQIAVRAAKRIIAATSNANETARTDAIVEMMKLFDIQSYEAIMIAGKLVGNAVPKTGGPDYSMFTPELVVEGFATYRIEQWWDCLKSIHARLVERGHDRRNRLVYNDLDNSAYYIPYKTSEHDPWERLATVWKDQNYVWLVMQCRFPEPHDVPLLRSLLVRKVWPRLRRNRYGDVTHPTIHWYLGGGWKDGFSAWHDAGHILTYQNGHVDRAAYFFAETEQFLMAVMFLDRALKEEIE